MDSIQEWILKSAGAPGNMDVRYYASSLTPTSTNPEILGGRHLSKCPFTWNITDNCINSEISFTCSIYDQTNDRYQIHLFCGYQIRISEKHSCLGWNYPPTHQKIDPHEKFCSMDNVSSTASMMFVRLLPYMCKFGGETKKYYFQLHHFCSQLPFVVRTQALSGRLGWFISERGLVVES